MKGEATCRSSNLFRSIFAKVLFPTRLGPSTRTVKRPGSATVSSTPFPLAVGANEARVEVQGSSRRKIVKPGIGSVTYVQ